MKSRFLMSKLLTSVLVVMFLVSMTTGCSDLEHTNTSGQVDMEKIVAVIPLFEISQSRKNRSEMAFIDVTGKVEIVRNTAMSGKTAVWTKQGLFYSDKDNDYFVSQRDGKIHTTRHQKTDFMYSSIAVDEDHVLSIYNSGLQDDIDTHAVLASSDGSHEVSSFALHGSMYTLARCGTDIYGIYRDIAASTHSKDPTWRPVLYKLSTQYRLQPVKHQILSFSLAELNSELKSILDNSIEIEFGDSGLTACKDNKIYATVSITDQGSRKITAGLLTWDVVTNECSILPLRNKQDEIIQVSNNDMGRWRSFNNADSLLIDDTYTMLDVDFGSLVFVDVTTGRTRIIDDPDIPPHRNYRYSIWANESRIYKIIAPINDNAGTHSYIKVYDRQLGTIVKTIAIDDWFTEHIQNDTVLPVEAIFNPYEPLFQ